MSAVTAVEQRLTDLLLALLAVPSETGAEGALADLLCARGERAGLSVRRVGDSMVLGAPASDRPTVLLVGHLDVVPPSESDREPRVDGTAVVGRGASDMKGGLAVALDCLEDAALRAGGYNLRLVAYAGEEGPQAGNELVRVLEAEPSLCEAELAVVLEPTDLAVQLGCLGGLHAEVAFTGRAAHSARPWHGENALTKAGAWLAWLHERAPEEVHVDGLAYSEVLTATGAWTPPAPRNVVPERCTVNLNYRFAPDKTLDEAEARLVALVAEGSAAVGEITVVDRAPPARPRREHPVVAAFVEAVGAPVEAKQAWTDVAQLDAAGVPALNYGPGITAQAHQPGEYVPVASLVTAREALSTFLGGRG